MNRLFHIILFAILMAAILSISPVYAWETVDETDAQVKESTGQRYQLDIFGTDADRLYRRYAGQFQDADVILEIDGDCQEFIPELRRFHFRSLELELHFDNEKEYADMRIFRGLLFPDCVTRVSVFCGEEQMILNSISMENFVIALAQCCPEAVLNDRKVSEWAKELSDADLYGMSGVFETDVRLQYLYELTETGGLEILPGDPVFRGKLLFLVMGDARISSQESLQFQEPFYSVPSSWLANSFEEADTVIYIFPEHSLIGRYANGGDAVCTYTKVRVVDLNSMQMYQTYIAVRNDPPESLTISTQNGEYSAEGAEGVFEPQKAINDILTVQKRVETVDRSKTDYDAQLSLFPWMSGTAEAEPVETSAAVQTTEEKQSPADLGEPELQEESTAAEQTAQETETKVPETIETTDNTETTLQEAPGPETETTTKPANRVIGTGSYSWLDEKLLEQIFHALGNEDYRKVYEGLKTSKDLVYGSRGTLALGIQNTLTAFDQTLKTDSSIGNESLGALNHVQAAFGLEQTQKINADIYAQLMPGLLYYTDAPKAEALFAEAAESSEGSLFTYLEACRLYLEGSGYLAKELFEDSRYGDYEDRIRNCVQDMPETGEIYRNPALTGKDAVLVIQVNSYDASAATCVQVFTEQDELAASLIIRGTGSAQTTLPAGRYRVQDGTGYRWYGTRDLFGQEGAYEVMIFDDGTDTIELLKGYDYTLTFNVLEHDQAALSVGSQEIEWEDLMSPEQE